MMIIIKIIIDDDYHLVHLWFVEEGVIGCPNLGLLDHRSSLFGDHLSITIFNYYDLCDFYLCDKCDHLDHRSALFDNHLVIIMIIIILIFVILVITIILIIVMNMMIINLVGFLQGFSPSGYMKLL